MLLFPPLNAPVRQSTMSRVYPLPLAMPNIQRYIHHCPPGQLRSHDHNIVHRMDITHQSKRRFPWHQGGPVPSWLLVASDFGASGGLVFPASFAAVSAFFFSIAVSTCQMARSSSTSSCGRSNACVIFWPLAWERSIVSPSGCGISILGGGGRISAAGLVVVGSGAEGSGSS